VTGGRGRLQPDLPTGSVDDLQVSRSLQVRLINLAFRARGTLKDQAKITGQSSWKLADSL
jgi:hypothetical protein